ncbi:MAG: flagellar biosynthesis protein FlhB [Planctomycetota bacterium]
MPDQAGEKTQEPTPHRRQKARENGQVARSQDLSSASLLVGATLVLMYFGDAVGRHLTRLAERQFGERLWLTANAQFIAYEWNRIVLGLATVLLPVFGFLLLLAVLVHLMQVGPMLLPQKLAPDVGNISPLKGIQRLVSLTSLVRLGFGLFKIAVVMAVAAWYVLGHRQVILTIGTHGIPTMASILFDILLGVCLRIGIALLILALLDYMFQKWKFEQDLKMTPQEVREEMKTLQGDPQMAARRRQVQRQLVLNRMQTDVPQADVVVTNPTELAVAIKYEPETMEAPIVVAKGAGLLAQRIRRLALEHDIPVIERKPLAQALHEQVDVNHPIPAEQYAAVAEILRYVYELQGRTLPGQSAA